MKKTVKILPVFAILTLLVLSVCIFVACSSGPSDVEAHQECSHSWTLESSSAGCTYGGDARYVCNRCKNVKYEYQDALGHDAVPGEAVAATCTTPGHTAGSICSRCNDILVPQEPVYVDHVIEIIPAVEAECTRPGSTEGQKCSVCKTVLVEPREIPAGHTIVTTEAVSATCTQDGLTEGQKCSTCDMVLKFQDVINAYGHNEVITYGYPATCTEDGLTDQKYCTNCDTIFQEHTVIPASHTEDVIPGYDATCSQDGLSDGKYCTVCGETTVEQTVITADHVIETLEGYAATCTSNGLTEGIVCSACGLVYKNQSFIYSEGHTFDENGECSGCDLKVSAGLVIELIENTIYSADASIMYKVVGIGDCNDSVIVIPEVYQDGYVVMIDDGAFANCTDITKVVIPASIRYVGENAFSGCYALEEIECKDFYQADEWAYNWRGDSECKLKAVFNQGRTPYEIYIEAMNNTGHNYDRYIYSTEAYTYFAMNGIVDRTKPVMEQRTAQWQCVNDCYYYQYSADYQDDGYGGVTKFNELTSELYYVGGYLYQPNLELYGTTYDLKMRVSLEYWFGTMVFSDMDFLTEEFFKLAEFYKAADGSMYLDITLDEKLMLEYIEKISGTEMPITLNEVKYSYTFDSQGRIVSFICTTGFPMGMMEDPNGNMVMVSTVMEVKGSFSQLGTLQYIEVPYRDWMDVTISDCQGHTPVEVPEVPGTCYMSGRSACSYCSYCYATVEPISFIDPGHDFENGECKDCGTLYNGSTGLSYVLNDDETGYIVVGLGGCLDTTVFVPAQIYGLPVVKVNADAFAGTDVEFVIVAGNNYSLDNFPGWDYYG